MKNKIYIFPRKDHGPLGKTYQALAEDGTPLGSHISSNLEWIKQDILSHSEDFESHYPNGYELVFREKCNEDVLKAIENNFNQFGKLYYDHPRNARIKIVFSDDDGKEFTKVIE